MTYFTADWRLHPDQPARESKITERHLATLEKGDLLYNTGEAYSSPQGWEAFNRVSRLLEAKGVELWYIRPRSTDWSPYSKAGWTVFPSGWRIQGAIRRKRELVLYDADDLFTREGRFPECERKAHLRVSGMASAGEIQVKRSFILTQEALGYAPMSETELYGYKGLN